MRIRYAAALLASLAFISHAAAERRLPTLLVEDPLAEPIKLPPNTLAPYNTIYLNRCANGCTIKVGGSSSITDSWPIASQRVLSKFPFSNDRWNDVVKCVKDVFSPFNLNVVETDPGSANHFEIMIAGIATDLDSSWTYGGIAPWSECSTYLNNGLVFAFAKEYATPYGSTTCDDSCVADICATAAQELGHIWNNLDHVQVASDPMTYSVYGGRRYFQDTEATCGSDCTNGMSPYGQTCSGPDKQTRDCLCGGSTQNSFQTVRHLFGLGRGTPPVTTITSPSVGETVEAGFTVEVEISEDSEIVTKVELEIDGQVISSLTEGPYVFTAPLTFGEGAHWIEVIAYDGHDTPGAAMVNVVVGPPCASEDDCTTEGDVCVGGRCVPGPTVDGGLGKACTDATTCASGQCESDGSTSYCVETCRVGECPADFGCLENSDDGTGVCWPGYDDGSGGCGCQTSRGSPAGIILALLVMMIACRRRRPASLHAHDEVATATQVASAFRRNC